ncbi:MAG TPA: sensor domain-containing diguanylate cyclase [Rhodocyclaceae bacterium]
MTEPTQHWELALDQPGSADPSILRMVLVFVVLIVAISAAVVAFGDVPLEAYPQFATFHAGFVFLVDAITAFVLFEQFRYQRRVSYAVLGCAYLFSSLVAVPFLLAFPGGLRADGLPVIGGKQSAIWAWHCWHLGFPALVALALLARRGGTGTASRRRVPWLLAGATAAALGLAAGVTVAITVFHDSLPVLIDGGRRPLSQAFYLAGTAAAVVTAVAAALAWRMGWQRRSVLHLWLAVSLTAFLADVAASLGAHARFTVGWYFGRVESMIAAGTLLLVFLSEADRLYRHISDAVADLSRANDQLKRMVAERDELVVQLRHSEEQVRQFAYYDSLTELPNRRLLLDRLGQAVAQARRHHYSMAVMFLDLDRFKQVNDTLGHEAGDDLLKQVALRWTGCVRAGDTVCRSGGDEFIVVLPEISQPQDAALVAGKMVNALSEPVVVGEHRIQASTSIGIAVYPVDGSDDVQELMKKADRAMYAAKAQGRNRYCFYGEVVNNGSAAAAA